MDRGNVHHKFEFQGRSLVSVDGDKKMIYQNLEDETATTKTQLRILQDFIKVHVLLDFSLTVKAAPHESVIRTGQP